MATLAKPAAIGGGEKKTCPSQKFNVKFYGRAASKRLLQNSLTTHTPTLPEAPFAAGLWYFKYRRYCHIRQRVIPSTFHFLVSFVVPAKYQPVIPTALMPALLQHAVILGRIGHMLKAAL